LTKTRNKIFIGILKIVPEATAVFFALY